MTTPVSGIAVRRNVAWVFHDQGTEQGGLFQTENQHSIIYDREEVSRKSLA